MAKSSMSDDRKRHNQRKTGANRNLIFRGVVALDEIDSFTGKDVVHMVLLFSDDLSFRLFSPRDSVAKRSAMAATLGSLCEALGTDFNDMPGCFGWEDFTTTFVDFMENHKRKQVYAKVTLNSGYWPTLGSGKCFSNNNDMEFSEADMTYLDFGDGDSAHPRDYITPPHASSDTDNDNLPPF